MLYFYFLASLALLFCGVAAQECYTFNGTWTQRRVCNPTYTIPASEASNPEAGDALSQFFSTLSTRPSKECAQAFAAFYCNTHYPECNADDSVKPGCVESCRDVIRACDEQRDIFTGTDFELPTSQECNNLSPDSAVCSVPQPADLSGYYADCEAVNITDYDVGTQLTTIICTPDYLVANLTKEMYTAAATVFLTFREMSTVLTMRDSSIGDEMYPCLKAIANYYCSIAFPSCNSNEALPVREVCSSTCNQVISACANYTDVVTEAGVLPLPSESACSELPSETCFTPVNNTWVGYFFDNNDPPVFRPTIPPTVKPTRAPIDIYPPRGPAVGGGIGAGVLIGLLLIIGLVMLLMKKQDSR